jgi:phosphatidylserine/phosphatidylglycerophosphate/cardiolipin synthase-like enzyme
MLGFIKNADGEGFALRAAVYEFSHKPALEAFRSAAKSGADVKIICDARKEEPYKTTEKAVKEVGIEDLMIKRTANPSYISHNKFIILLKVEEGQEGDKKLKPLEVWTGSTNYTAGGIYGQSNVGHIVRDHEVAEKYYDYWQKLAEDPELKEFRPWNKEHTSVSGDAPPPNSITPIFSPRPTINALEWYADRMDKAKITVNFTAAFGVNKRLVSVFQEDKEYLRYLILDNPGSTKTVRERTEEIQLHKDNRVAIGAYLEEDTGELHQWTRERLIGLNNHVKYLHTKYMIIDALSDDPILISGSANFSDNSTKNNDENMVIVRGNTRVTDMYLGEFMRLFNHFYFRDIANRQAKEHGSQERESTYLVPDDSWTDPYYEQDSVKWKERLLFRGKKNTGHGITFFDIDETIFHTSALIWVMKDGKVVKKLDNQTYNTYKLEEGESFDYREFGDAKLFERTSKIIRPTLAKIKAMMKNALRTGSKLALLTARRTFSDMANFKKTFQKYGIRIEKMNINFAGDISAETGSTAEAKKQIVLKYLSHGEYKRARLLDDNIENLNAFLSIAKEMPSVQFTAIYIDKKGKTKTIRPKKNKKKRR